VLDDPAAHGRGERRPRPIRADFPLEEQRRREISRRGRRGALAAAGKPGDHALDRRVHVGSGSAPEEAFARALEKLTPPRRVPVPRSEDQGKKRVAPEELVFRERVEAGVGKAGSQRARRPPRARFRWRDDGDVSGDLGASQDRFKLSGVFGWLIEIG
jgi:hypothetical protein